MRVCVYLAEFDLKSAFIASLKSIFKTYKKKSLTMFIRRCVESYLELTSSITVEKQLTNCICHCKEATSLKKLFEEIIICRLYNAVIFH